MRVLVALLLVLTLATAGRPSTVRRSPLASQDEERKLLPEEEREALSLVARLKERLRATGDFGPIVDEMFVRDFQERLWQVSRDWLPWAFLDEILPSYASREGLRRYYVAWMNFYAVIYQLAAALKALKKEAGVDKYEVKARDIFSPEIVNVLTSDRTLARFAKEFIEEEHEDESAKDAGSNQTAEDKISTEAAGTQATEAETSGTSDGDDGAGLIKTPRQLEDVSATIEKANELLRKRLSVMTTALPTAPPPGDVQEEKGEEESSYLYPTTLDEDEYGFPQGTRVIHAEASSFCVLLIRIDGRLQILSVAIAFD